MGNGKEQYVESNGMGRAAGGVMQMGEGDQAKRTWRAGLNAGTAGR